jgi:hypothetical protein
VTFRCFPSAFFTGPLGFFAVVFPTAANFEGWFEVDHGENRFKTWLRCAQTFRAVDQRSAMAFKSGPAFRRLGKRCRQIDDDGSGRQII